MKKYRFLSHGLFLLFLLFFLFIACEDNPLQPPTPQGQVATPTFTPTDGAEIPDGSSDVAVFSTQTLTIATATEGATIRYTAGAADIAPPTSRIGTLYLDTNKPTFASLANDIAGPYPKSLTVKAIAIRAGYRNSELRTTTFRVTLPPPLQAVQKPTFTIAGTEVPDGSSDVAVFSTQTLTISTSPADAEVYYIVGEGDLSVSGIRGRSVSFSSHEDTTITVRAYAVKARYRDSDIASATFRVTLPPPLQAVQKPTFTIESTEVPDGSSDFAVLSTQTLTISTSPADVEVYYIVGEGDLSASDSRSKGKSVSFSSHGGTTVTVRAYAVKAGYRDSDTASATFRVTVPQVAKPTFTLTDGAEVSDGSSNVAVFSTQTLIISTSPADAEVHYTVGEGDLSVPGPGIIRGRGKSVSFSSHGGTTITVRVYAVKAGYRDSDTASATFRVTMPQVEKPTFTIGSTAVPDGSPNFAALSNQRLAIRTGTGAAEIYYTIGSDDLSDSGSRSKGRSVSFSAHEGRTITIRAIAIRGGYSDSDITTATFIVRPPVAATPTFSVGGRAIDSSVLQTVTTAQDLTIESSTDEATIRYTLDGVTAPTDASAMMGASPLTLEFSTIGTGSKTIRAIATKMGYDNSAPARARFTVSNPPVATPMISVGGQPWIWSSITRYFLDHQYHHRRGNHLLHRGRKRSE